MDSASHATLPLVNPDGKTERENRAYEHMRKEKHALGFMFCTL